MQGRSCQLRFVRFGQMPRSALRILRRERRRSKRERSRWSGGCGGSDVNIQIFFKNFLAFDYFTITMSVLHRSFSPVSDERRGKAAVFRVWIYARCCRDGTVCRLTGDATTLRLYGATFPHNYPFLLYSHAAPSTQVRSNR